MTAVRAYYDGKSFVPVTPVKAEKDQEAIVTILDFPVKSDFELCYYDPNETLEECEKRKREFLSMIGSIPHEDIVEMESAIAEQRSVVSDEW